MFSDNTDFVRNSGSYRIATFLREEHNIDVEVIEWANHFTLQELKYIFTSRVTSDTLFCGFGTMFQYWNENINTFLNWIKFNFPNIITIVGGQLCQNINASPHYFINGYAEKSLLEILKYHFTNYEGNLKLDEYWLNKNKRVIHYNYYPSAPLKSLLIKYEDRDYIDSQERLVLEFSRGCIFECKFCSFPILGVKTDYSRDASDLELHLKTNYDKYGVSNYYVADETFNDSTIKLKKFADVIKLLDFNPHFSGFIRADLLLSKSRTQDIDHLLNIGFYGHYYGIETFNHYSGKVIGKGKDPEELKAGLLEIKKRFTESGNYRGSIGMIIGLPGENRDSIDNTLKWLLDNWRDQNFLFWPLELSNNSSQDKLSEFARNKEKYGYVESVEGTTVLAREEYMRGTQVGTTNSFFNWKNEHFTYSEAKKLGEEIRINLINNGVKLSNFELNKYYYHYQDIKKVLDIKYSDIPILRDVANNSFYNKIQKYKTSKLEKLSRL